MKPRSGLGLPGARLIPLQIKAFKIHLAEKRLQAPGSAWIAQVLVVGLRDHEGRHLAAHADRLWAIVHRLANDLGELIFGAGEGPGHGGSVWLCDMAI
jgi:hypothetical protein